MEYVIDGTKKDMIVVEHSVVCCYVSDRHTGNRNGNTDQ